MPRRNFTFIKQERRGRVYWHSRTYFLTGPRLGCIIDIVWDNREYKIWRNMKLKSIKI